MVRRPWDKDELLAALNLYCLTPFGRIHSRNPEVVELAKAIGRTPSAVALKMVNFASLDPTIDQKGMANVSKLDQVVWDEFFEELRHSLGDKENSSNVFEEDIRQGLIYEELPGLDEPIIATRRINQEFFRRLVLASYESKCAATGIDAPQLLVAGHIVPWSKDSSLRTNPRNGICLNCLFDRAFDRGLITISENLTLSYSSTLPPETVRLMRNMASDKLCLPNRFRPDPEYFDYHRKNVFRP